MVIFFTRKILRFVTARKVRGITQVWLSRTPQHRHEKCTELPSPGLGTVSRKLREVIEENLPDSSPVSPKILWLRGSGALKKMKAKRKASLNVLRPQIRKCVRLPSCRGTAKVSRNRISWTSNPLKLRLLRLKLEWRMVISRLQQSVVVMNREWLTVPRHTTIKKITEQLKRGGAIHTEAKFRP